MNGILLIDKPSDWTSFDVVAKVRGIIKRETGIKKPKVGHTGTLDPLATGLLVLVIGDYCKRASELSKADKTYEVTMRLGQNSTTGDEEGEKTIISDTRPEAAAIKSAFGEFTGKIMQKPPAFSAVKVSGQRAYKLARAGKAVQLDPRQVEVYSLSLTSYSYPEVKFKAEVSSGTYIRVLVEDIGAYLETGAYMSALRRSKVGLFSLENSLPVQGLTASQINEALLIRS